MLIAGEEDQNNRAVSFRFRDGTQKNGVPISQAIDEILETIKTRNQV
jgi:threonyl-tRNA synthetase